jgi:hypothetical protein
VIICLHTAMEHFKEWTIEVNNNFLDYLPTFESRTYYLSNLHWPRSMSTIAVCDRATCWHPRFAQAFSGLRAEPLSLPSQYDKRTEPASLIS